MIKTFDKKLGNILETIRNKNNLSQQDVADRIGLSHSAISCYEFGKRTIDVETLFKLCDIYNADVNEILKDVRKYVYKK